MAENDHTLSEKQYIQDRTVELGLKYRQSFRTDVVNMTPQWKAEFAAKSLKSSPKPFDFSDLGRMRESRGISDSIAGELVSGREAD